MTVRVRVPRVEWENMGLVLKVVYDPLIPADVFAASVPNLARGWNTPCRVCYKVIVWYYGDSLS